MPTQIFVNLPVKDLNKSKQFFERLGYKFNPQFTDENAACLVISDTIYAMLLTEKFFSTFTKKSITDSTRSTEAIIALSCESRDEVDRIVDRALESGGKKTNETDDKGFMYTRSFEDPDGHNWEYIYMDMAAFAKMQEQSAVEN